MSATSSVKPIFGDVNELITTSSLSPPTSDTANKSKPPPYIFSAYGSTDSPVP